MNKRLILNKLSNPPWVDEYINKTIYCFSVIYLVKDADSNPKCSCSWIRSLVSNRRPLASSIFTLLSMCLFNRSLPTIGVIISSSSILYGSQFDGEICTCIAFHPTIIMRYFMALGTKNCWMFINNKPSTSTPTDTFPNEHGILINKSPRQISFFRIFSDLELTE